MHSASIENSSGSNSESNGNDIDGFFSLRAECAGNLLIGGTRITDPSQIANNFNHYFVNVANEITSKIPLNPKSPLSYLKSANPETFFFFPTTSDEVSNVIKSLVNGKSTGPNSIPIKLLKILILLFLGIFLLS